MASGEIASASWIVGSDVATTWTSRRAMNMPRHIRTKPNQVAILAGVVLQTVMSFGLMLSASMQAGKQILNRCGKSGDADRVVGKCGEAGVLLSEPTKYRSEWGWSTAEIAGGRP